MKDDARQKSQKAHPGLQPPKPKFVPPEVIPDELEVPPDTILVIPDDNSFVNPPHFVRAQKNRDWFLPPFYHCLPLVFGNQHGFLMLATYDFVIRWDGRNEVDGIKIHFLEDLPTVNFVTVESHFGSGILTVQSRYVFKTPKGVNMLVKEPPNYPMRGLSWMNAVVETDNLRRDFTFNIKVTEADTDIYIAAGTPLGCLLPYPRYFLDDYNMAELQESSELKKAQKTMGYFATERGEYDNNNPRHRYMEGIDIYGLEFEEHQKSLDHGKWWRGRKDIPGAVPNQSGKKKTFWDWLGGDKP
jgi:hypothetical protein